MTPISEKTASSLDPNEMATLIERRQEIEALIHFSEMAKRWDSRPELSPIQEVTDPENFIFYFSGSYEGSAPFQDLPSVSAYKINATVKEMWALALLSLSEEVRKPGVSDLRPTAVEKEFGFQPIRTEELNKKGLSGFELTLSPDSERNLSENGVLTITSYLDGPKSSALVAAGVLMTLGEKEYLQAIQNGLNVWRGSSDFECPDVYINRDHGLLVLGLPEGSGRGREKMETGLVIFKVEGAGKEPIVDRRPVWVVLNEK